jgi:pimeloyl-ACP methyl ester carboxylesterase
LGDEASPEQIVDALEEALDAVGWDTAHLAGSSLGGYLALKLAERDRARSVVAFAPAGGWPVTEASAPGGGRRAVQPSAPRGGRQAVQPSASAGGPRRADAAAGELFALQERLHEQLKRAAPHAEAVLATRPCRRAAIQYVTVNFDHIPVELLAHQLRAGAACQALALIHAGRRLPWSVDAERVRCPVRIVWGTEDRLLPWPATAARYRAEWLPHADWVVLDDVGHCPQLDVPLEAAQLIVGFTAA